MQWSGLIGIGIATTLLTCCISGIAVILRFRSYQHELSSREMHPHRRMTDYQNLCYTAERMSIFIALASLFVGIASAFLTTISLFSAAFLSHPSFMAGLLFCLIIAPNLVIPGLLYDLLGIFWIDAPALSTFHGSTIEPKQALIIGLKSSVIGPLQNERRFRIGPSPSLLTLLLLEMLGLLYSFRLPSLIWLIPLLALCGNLSSFITGSKYIADWTTHATTLEQSPWAALVLHIDEWARVAGIKIQDIRVQTMIRVGRSDGIICGIFHSRLLLNNTFLAHSDWRQQEALLAWMIRLAHKKFPVTYLWLNSSHSVITWTFLATGVAVLLSASPPQPFLGRQLLLLPIIAILYFTTTFFTRYQLKRSYFEADHFAANQTSDPLALIVALHTIHLLNAGSTRLPTNVQKRIHALSQLTQNPTASGHWNQAPVPSLFPFSLAEKTLTTPLDQSEDATFHAPEATNVVHLNDYKTGKQSARGIPGEEIHSLEEPPGREQT